MQICFKKRYLLCADFIVNCGGVTIGTAEIYGLTYDEAFKKIDIVRDNVYEIDRIAREKESQRNKRQLRWR